MKPKRNPLTIFLAFLSCVIFTTNHVSGAEPEAAEKKVYSIYVKGTGKEMGIVLTNLVREDFHGVPCFAGIGIVSYTKGIRIRIPIESIAMVMEYESEEALNDLSKQFGDNPRQHARETHTRKPAPRSESKSEASDKPQPESEKDSQ